MAGGRPLGNRRAKRRRITRPIDSSCPGLFHETHLEVVVVASTMRGSRPVLVGLDLDPRLTSALGVTLLRGHELALGGKRLVLREPQHLLALLAHLLGKLHDGTIGDEVCQAVMHASRFAALRGARNA